MAAAVRERILQKIKTRLELISTANGYQADLAPPPYGVQRFLQFANPVGGQLPVLVIRSEGSEESEYSDTHTLSTMRVSVAIYAIHLDNEFLGGEATETVVHRHFVDVRRAIMEDRELGGLVEQVLPVGVSNFEDEAEQAFAGLRVLFDIDFLERTTDPSKGRGQ